MRGVHELEADKPGQKRTRLAIFASSSRHGRIMRSARESASDGDESLTTVSADEAGHERTRQDLVVGVRTLAFQSNYKFRICPALSGFVRYQIVKLQSRVGADVEHRTCARSASNSCNRRLARDGLAIQLVLPRFPLEPDRGWQGCVDETVRVSACEQRGPGGGYTEQQVE
jgi:hypothetical protein